MVAVDAAPSFAVTFTGLLGGSPKPGASLDVIAPTTGTGTGPTLVTFPQAFAGADAVTFVAGVPGFSIDDLPTTSHSNELEAMAGTACHSHHRSPVTHHWNVQIERPLRCELSHSLFHDAGTDRTEPDR